ncbi:MAG: tetratricopeptide repeat protein [Candidatus Competibacteraceae bacterium]
MQGAQGLTDEATESYCEALRLKPGYGAAHANLGRLYLGQNNYPNAAEHYAAAVQALPESAEVWVGLGSALEELTERRTEAVEAYQRALTIQPDFAGAKLNLGRLLMALKRPDEAAEQLESLLPSAPDHVLGHVWLGKVMSDMGYSPQAVNLLRRAQQLDLKNPNIINLLLLTMNYLPDCSPEDLFAAHREYGRYFTAEFPLSHPVYHHWPDPERRLKVGYVSADFRSHPLARFIEPVFVHHDRTNFEIHVFYNYHTDDAITTHLKKFIDAWHPIWGIEDEAVARQVRALGIDVLIDLSGHNGHHRLPMFALKPAPVQATWLNYPGTTGLTTMDYRICDAYTDPPGLTEHLHTEQLARLPGCQWCYQPRADLPPVGESPQRRNGYMTLGSFNNAAKVNDQVLALWAEVLNALPKAKLCIAAAAPGRAQQRFISILSAAGVARERLEFLPYLPYREYLSAISKVDLALDPFPYNGGTTSFDALIMGVPFVTLAGDRSIARGGVSILTNLGLPDLIAHTPAEYVEIVLRLANDPQRLIDLRQTLRERLWHSPLMDGKRFTGQLELLYRQMWRAWCVTQQ